ncbi:MAG TPA: asparagine synthase (glutamine-hydrolyzing) [Kiritimatiellia bacterium]|nr:asparagine synthase (glutamine-hydrolyzing) [Kiritimatiellia bacterium]HMP35225.1 asparagine synthase (glutamine-hydrolyzing) [Kiritimatiellia bacterium]
MCGIAGFTTFAPLADATGVIRNMASAIAHRGPDGEGFYEDPGIALGHRRLSIIDIECGRQPMSTPDGRHTLCFNGEIYNYIELRQALEREGQVFATHSDTEVLLHQLRRHGPAGLDDVNGMFAFAFWDRDAGTLLIARDRIGIKPLYYAQVGCDLVFASELKALLRHPGVSREIEPLSVSKYITFGYIPAPHTIFKAVHKLEPGAYAQFTRSGLGKALYWDIPLTDNPISGLNADECAAQFLDLFRDAVAKQLRSDVPVGVFLSGGIDSSLSTAVAATQVPGKLHTFSVGFEESSYDESPYARMVAERYGTEHHHDVLSLQKAVSMFPTVMGILDEPFGDASILPTYLLSQFTAQHVKVILGGDGGDELFAGYPSFQAHRVMEKLSFLPTGWRDALNRLARKLPVSQKYASAGFLLEQFFKGAGVSPEIRFFLWMGPYSNEQKRGLLTAELQKSILRQNPFEDILRYVNQSGLVSDFERILYLCMKMYLQDDILVKVDRASMAHGLEVRVPYLDHGIVEYMSGVQSVYKLHGFTSKYLLKKAAVSLLPPEIIKRRKAGFMIPLATWLKADLKPIVEDLCSESRIKRDGYFNPAFVRTMLDDHYAGRRDYRKMIWTLLAFQMWKENYG